MTYNDILERTVRILQEDDAVKRIARDISLAPTNDDTPRLTPSVQVILTTPFSVSESAGYTGETDTQYTEKIDIKITVATSTIKQSVIQLNNLMEAVYETFRKNRQLVLGDGSDPMFVRSIPDIRTDQKNTGKIRQSATVTITGQVGEDILLKIKDFKHRIYVLYESGGTDVINRSVHLSDSGNLDGYAATGKQKTRAYILEDTKDGVYQAFKNIQDGLLEVTSITLGETTTYMAHISRLQPSLDTNSKPIITLAFDVI